MRWLAAISLALTLGCGSGTGAAPPPEAGPLEAGVATVPLDAPVGVPTGGYSKPSPAEPESPWSVRHPATTGVQTVPTARALALSDGVTTVALVRVDLCLTTATLRLRAQSALRALGHDVPLIVSATHTHSGPARYFHPAPVDGSGGFDPTTVAMDVFDPEVEARLSASIAQAAAQALASRHRVSVAVATVDAGAFNRDRRCENDDLYGPGFRDTTLTVVRFDEVDADAQPVRPLTGIVHFALHGTFLDAENPLFSVDAPGALELFASDAVGVPLVFLQGAAGDVSPSPGASGFDAFQSMERLGVMAAPLVADAFARARPLAAPARATLVYRERVVTPSREAIGYAPGEFPEHGAVGCGFGASSCPAVATPKDQVYCLPLKPRSYRQTSFAALRIGPVLIGTLPGEPTAAIGERVKALGAKVPGVTHVLTAGYAMDHFGYLLEEDDYLRLGYEPSVSPLGWRFGDYVLEQLGATFDALGAHSDVPAPPAEVAAAPRTVTDSGREPLETTAPVDVARLDTARFEFEGGDPALGTPSVSLEVETPSGFVPVMASPTRPVVNGPEVVLRYRATPSFTTSAIATTRWHTWTAEWETLPSTPLGRYRFVARGRAQRSGEVRPYEVPSTPFSVAPSDALGAAAEARWSGDALSLVLRFPPNPPVVDAGGRVLGHYRVRDPLDDPRTGARGHGGAVDATVTPPGAAARPVTLSWDDTTRAFVARGLPASSGAWKLDVAAHAAHDGDGNTNAQALSLTVTR
ncbi:MAG: neutral/alkaline non-lysosomal ceramidase N-terminal domain-containing protein [Myxococcota bacterium]